MEIWFNETVRKVELSDSNTWWDKKVEFKSMLIISSNKFFIALLKISFKWSNDIEK